MYQNKPICAALTPEVRGFLGEGVDVGWLVGRSVGLSVGLSVGRLAVSVGGSSTAGGLRPQPGGEVARVEWGMKSFSTHFSTEEDKKQDTDERERKKESGPERVPWEKNFIYQYAVVFQTGGTLFFHCSWCQKGYAEKAQKENINKMKSNQIEGEWRRKKIK